MLVDDDDPETGAAGVVWGGGAGGAAVCANAATAHRHATHDSRTPLVALRYTSDLVESPQDITPDLALRAWSRQGTTLRAAAPQELFANGAGENNRSRDADRSGR